MTGEADAVVVTRSRLDPAVWVPYPSGFGDQSAFLHAGGLRAVKRWAEREYGVVGWKKTGPDHWEGSFS
jgi:hypothetical protein